MSDVTHVPTALLDVLHRQLRIVEGIQHRFPATLGQEAAGAGKPSQNVHLLAQLEVAFVIVESRSILDLHASALDEVIWETGQVVLRG